MSGAARSKAWVCGRSPAEIAGSNRAGCMDVSGECCVLSDRGLCIGLINRRRRPAECVCLNVMVKP
jgi:hypothetical protein